MIIIQMNFSTRRHQNGIGLFVMSKDGIFDLSFPYGTLTIVIDRVIATGSNDAITGKHDQIS